MPRQALYQFRYNNKYIIVICQDYIFLCYKLEVNSHFLSIPTTEFYNISNLPKKLPHHYFLFYHIKQILHFRNFSVLLDYYLSTLVSPLILHILLFVKQPHLTELSQILFLYILFLYHYVLFLHIQVCFSGPNI